MKCTVDSGQCTICSHGEHECGQCKQCNCGESEIVHPRPAMGIINTEFGDYVHRLYLKSPTVTGERHYQCQ